VKILEQKEAPNTTGNQLGNLRFQQMQQAYVASWQGKDVVPDDKLAFVLPQTADDYQIFVEQRKGETFFYLNFNPSLYRQDKNLPDRICLLWDVSRSGKNRDLDKELALLGQYFDKIGKLQIELVPFHIQAEASQVFDIRNGEWSELRQRLESIQYDGGTQLGNLDLSRYRCDEFILSTDGLSTLGSQNLERSNTPMMVLNSNPSADHAFLRYIAQQNNGQYINAFRLSPEQAEIQMGSLPYRFLGAKTNAREIYPSIATDVSGSFGLAGKMGRSPMKMTLEFGFGSEVVHSVEVQIPEAHTKAADGMVSKLWAQKKLAELDLQADWKRFEIVDLGLEFGIVSRFTSLIVLDRVEDYVENEIVPPAELQKEYEELLAQKQENERISFASHLDQVAENFFLRKEWWQKDFEIPDGMFVDKDTRKNADRDDAGTYEAAPTQESDISALEGQVAGDAEDSWDEVAEETVEEAPPSPRMAKADEKRKQSQTGSGDGGRMELNTWNPEAPYLDAIKQEASRDRYAAYLRLAEENASTPAFFLDLAHFFYQEKDLQTALRILSNLAELELENHELLRVLAHKLEEENEINLAISVYRQVVEIREEEPQSYRDLALALAKAGQYQEAVALMYKVVSTKWDTRFPQISTLAAQEMNSLIARSGKALKLDFIDKRVMAKLPTDIRVVLNWDTDAVDMDLWVIDPRGEKCYYAHRETEIGGWMSNDFTGGYGPEEFLIKNAMPGKYTVQVNYYGSSQTRLAGPTHIHVQMITGYGTAKAKQQEVSMRLAQEKGVIDVGSFEFAE
ncbi:MAG: DUF2135 domain-containing protein, partial [Bacteroidota bacterium]